MKQDLLYDNFIEAIKKAIPENGKISTILANLLSIEKEAVYRRLRKEVPFTFSEMAIISQEMGISLDNIISFAPEKSRPFQLKLIKHEDPMDVDLALLEDMIHILNQLTYAQDSEIGISCNVLPLSIYLNYEYVSRFYLFKWKYMYEKVSTIKRYKEIEISLKLRKIHQNIINWSQQIKTINYILDNMVFHYLVNDIRYFTSIHLITEEEVQSLKKEIIRLIDNTELLAARGHNRCGNKINLYISNINIETSYTYFESHNYRMSMIKAFSLNAVTSRDELTYDEIKSWMHSLKRVSILISESGEKQRILFFEKQREVVNTL